MKYSELLNYCLSKNGAYIDHPFGPESDIIKVEGKIFAQLFVLKGIETATLNCERMTGDFLQTVVSRRYRQRISLSCSSTAIF